MFKNYLKIAIRNLIKYKKYSLINISGLAIGLASVMLILIWVQDELSFDKFHTNSEQIYLSVRSENGDTSVVTPIQFAQTLKSEIPEVLNATAYVSFQEAVPCYLEYKDKGFTETFALIDSEFFNIFSFEFLSGDIQSSFVNLNSLILTEKMAQKYFGTSDAVGKSLQLTILGHTKILTITGILKNLPKNTHFKQDIYLNRKIMVEILKQSGVKDWDSWGNRSVSTYIQVQKNTDISQQEQKLTKCEQSHLPNQDLKNLSYSLLPLEDIHLHGNQINDLHATGDIRNIYIFLIIAFVILLIACINYINLSNVLMLRRTKEIGIQRIVGAKQIQLVFQYLGESFIVTIIAMGFSIVLSQLSLPLLNQISSKSLSISYTDPKFLLMLFVLSIITSLLTGISPAVMMSSFQPIQILKGKFKTGGKKFNLGKAMIIFQFTLSIIIIISTVLVFNQLNFMLNGDLGFDKENIICLKAQGDVQTKYNAFKSQLLKNPNIQSVTRTEPMSIQSIGATEGISWPGKIDNFSIKMINCDIDYDKTYKIEMADGRFYSEEYPLDRKNAYVLNEAAVKEMGLESPIGNPLKVWNREGTIIGIVKDFHYFPFHHKIDPLVMRIPDKQEENLYYREFSIRVQSHSISSTLDILKAQWKVYYPTEKFDYYFFDDSLNTNYQAEQRMGNIFKYFSILAIFIACLGLYGLTAFTIEQKTKDIGIHKIMGATIPKIILLLLKNYFWLIVVANIFAWSIAWYTMDKWLQNFAYRIDMTIWPFLLAGLAALAIALLTVIWQAIKAATANPVDALKYE